MHTLVIVPVEFHLLRDWQPRSRPGRGEVHIGEGRPIPDVTKLYPGAAAVGTETMLIYVEKATRIDHMWASARVSVVIEGTHIGGAMPVTWYLGESDTFSGVVHLPVVAGADNLMYKGHHSLLMRSVR